MSILGLRTSHAALESLLADLDRCIQVNEDYLVYAIHVEGVIRNLARLNDLDPSDQEI